MCLAAAVKPVNGFAAGRCVERSSGVKQIIEAKHLFKLYRVGDSIVRALNGVDFSIYEGEFCAIVGNSGFWKSTLLNMLAGRTDQGRDHHQWGTYEETG